MHKNGTIVPSKNPDESDKLFIADVDELVEVDNDTIKIVKSKLIKVSLHE